MNLNEINKQKWKVSKKLEVTNFTYGTHLSLAEQECHMNFSRIDNKIKVFSCWQTYINKLSKSEFFTLEALTISTKTKEKYIISVSGSLDIKGVSIKKNRRKYSLKQRKELRERALKNLKGVNK